MRLETEMMLLSHPIQVFEMRPLPPQYQIYSKLLRLIVEWKDRFAGPGVITNLAVVETMDS